MPDAAAPPAQRGRDAALSCRLLVGSGRAGQRPGARPRERPEKAPCAAGFVAGRGRGMRCRAGARCPGGADCATGAAEPLRAQVRRYLCDRQSEGQGRHGRGSGGGGGGGQRGGGGCGGGFGLPKEALSDYEETQSASAASIILHGGLTNSPSRILSDPSVLVVTHFACGTACLETRTLHAVAAPQLMSAIMILLPELLSVAIACPSRISSQ